MSAGLEIVAVGPGVTLQDGGRRGFLRFGITPAGPMDPWAHATANRALGNPPSAAAIEVSLGGIEVEARGEAFSLALCGGDFEARLDGVRLPGACLLPLAPGQRLSIRAGVFGAWATLAVAGRIDLVPVLGSLATHARSGLGGVAGRGLAAGDFLPIVEARAVVEAPTALVAPWLAPDHAPIRVLLGPQDDFFAADQIELFLARDWVVSARSDRMARALEGAPLTHRRGHDIVSDAVAMGAIQVPGSGLPFVLMADRQPTGGYPKIATVIGADLGRLAQRRPGERVRFAAVSYEAAVVARRAMTDRLVASIEHRPLVREAFSAEFLLAANLVSGMVDAAPGAAKDE